MSALEEKYFIDTVRCGVFNTPAAIPPAQLDYKVLFRLITQNACEVISYYALSPIGENLNKQFFSALESRAKILSMKDVKQNFEMERILSMFAENKIKCMPLKGYYVRHLYPKTEMRYLSDFDLLVDSAKIEKTREIMLSNGYKKEKYDEHHDCYINPVNGCSVELHKVLIVGKLQQYFGVGFERAKKKDNSDYIYELSKEDEYIFILGHMCYHFAHTGVGVRSIIDVRMFLDKYEEKLDREYIDIELKKCGLFKLAKQIEKLSRVWFLNEESDCLTEKFGKYILESGLLGNSENLKNIEIAKKYDKNASKAKSKALFRIIFPVMTDMKFLYPYLKKYPFLVPVAFVDRWFRVLFEDRNRLKRISGAINADDEVVKDLKDLYSALEIDKI